ncbi:MAG: YfcC family protein [Spirochaetaceae bacterium]|nr:YfcC family protein [Spirochaetaceae bacterium]
MAEKKAGVSIGARAFLASFLILLALMVGAGVLTRVVPTGSFERVQTAEGTVIDPASYRQTPRPDYPVWRWFTAPFEVLGSEDALTVIVIVAFIAIVGGSFAVLQRAGILQGAVDALARRAGGRKYRLLALVTLFFMLIGSLMGIFEEVIPLVPVAIALAVSLGWDLTVGLGMSILATGFGFSAAIANPFSIGTAQRLAGVPVFSGAAFRVAVFALIYALYVAWLVRAAKRSERLAAHPAVPPAPAAGPAAAPIATSADADEAPDPVSAASTAAGEAPRVARGIRFFAVAAVLLLAAVMTISLTGSLSDYSMPITAVLFLAAGLGSGLVAGLGARRAAKAFWEGLVAVLPAAVLILMAISVKRIIVSGGIIDTILETARRAVADSSSYGAAALIYLLTLFMNFFIGSATAKAFLLIPIIAPLGDLAGVSRQTVIQAFAFGDGFSNMLYPTNAVLLISLGIAGMSWPTWIKKTWKLQAGMLLVTMALLMLAVAIGYS